MAAVGCGAVGFDRKGFNGRSKEHMNRPYDNIPRQGEHLTDPLKTEPTSNVRAQEAPHPIRRSKETRRVFRLLKNEADGSYRLDAVQKDAEPVPDGGYEVIARVPEAGDVGSLYDLLPGPPRYAVFENTDSGTVYYAPDRQVSGDWTDDEMFDRVTIFTDAARAEAHAEARRAAASSSE